MRISHKEVRRRINEEKSKITDRTFFTSGAFQAYLLDMAEAATGRYKQKLQMQTSWDTSDSAMIACTDNKKIYINTGNYITESFPTRVLKADSLIGLNAHEIGHILFTDFAETKRFMESLKEGRLYPDVPEGLSEDEEENLKMLQEKLANGEKKEISVILRVAKKLLNVLEDGYIEECVCVAFPGKFATGIYLNNLRFVESIPSVDEQLKEGNYSFSIMMNLLIQYCRSGDINNRDHYEGELLDLFYELLPIVDNAVYDDKIQVRMDAVNRLMIRLWEYIETLLEEARENADDSEGTPEDDVAKKVLQKLEEQILKEALTPVGEGKPIAKELLSKDTGIMQELEQKKERIRRYFEKNCARIPLKLTTEINEGDEGGIEYDPDYEGEELNDAKTAIDRILDGLAAEEVAEAQEIEMTEELREAIKEIRLGNAHKGINIKINRMSSIPVGFETQYQSIAPPLLALSKQIQKRLHRIHRDSANSGKETGLLIGRRIEARLLQDTKGRIFSKNRLPSPSKELAVALLIDESGSMSGDRAAYARASAVIVYDFCKAMDIPVLVMGHTASGFEVDLFAYTDFDSRDPKDRYRMMDISARNGNRDGAALRYVAERLMKQPEETKLLILISDGQPASTDYSGTAAEADLRGIKREYTNKGMIFLAAAIGSDKENIERIYGNAFLDITDLKMLPYLLVKRIEKEMRG